MSMRRGYVFATVAFVALSVIVPSLANAFVPGGAGSSRQSLSRSLYRAQEGARRMYRGQQDRHYQTDAQTNQPGSNLKTPEQAACQGNCPEPHPNPVPTAPPVD